MSFILELLKRNSKNGFFLLILLFVGAGLLCYFLSLHYLKQSFYEADRLFAETKTENYIGNSGLGSLSERKLPLSIQDVNELGSLAFVKLMRQGEHLLLVNETHSALELGDLLHLPSSLKDEWLFFSSHEEPFVVVQQELSNGALVQTGAIAAHYDTYHSFKDRAWVVLLFYLMAAVILSFLLVRLAQAPIRKTAVQIAEMAELRTPIILEEQGNGGSLNTLHKEINKLVQQNRRLVSEIQGSLDNVAHDLRTPVTRLRSVAEYGLQSDDLERLKNALADCLEESEQIAAMLKIMMSVAEAESGTMNLELSSTELSSGIKDVIDLYEYVAEDKGMIIDLETVEPLYVNIDSVRMRQVWANLLDNALKYGRVGGHVKISLVRQGQNCLIRFEDDGIGISPSEQNKIWERLYRGDRSRSEKGLGLGLNYVRAVIEAHGGTVSVSSVLNDGSVFEVLLPVSAPVLVE